MNEVVQFFLAAGVMIAFAKLMGWAAYRMHQPAALGELIAGLLIGPTVLNFLNNTTFFHDGDLVKTTIVKVAEVGVLLLLFNAGLEVDPGMLMTVGRPALAGGLLGVAVPVLMMVPAVMIFGYSFEKSLFMGILFASMSTVISAQVMFELRVLKKPEGLTLLGAALVDDAVVIFALSLFLAVNPGGIVAGAETRSVVEVFARMVFFLTAGSLLAWIVIPRLANRIAQMPISEGPLMLAIVTTLLFGWAAEFIGGIATITGAFMAGVGMRRARRGVIATIEKGVHSINYAFLVPLFFISIGLKSDLRLLTGVVMPFALVVTVIAVVSKLIGVMAGTRLSGFGWRSSLRVSIGMMSRGEVGLIIAAIGIDTGILQPEVFAVVVFVVIITTIITPPLLRWSFMERTPWGQPAE